MAFKLKESRGEATFQLHKYLSANEWESAAVQGIRDTVTVGQDDGRQKHNAIVID
jgi:hypothetical protein